jgi:16S rRNA (cytidine1402-2'-O)-methyltransferase
LRLCRREALVSGAEPGTGGPGLGVLYVVASPLGNPGDFSPRAVSSLAAADVVFAEDTRTARRLCEAHGISAVLRSCFDANEAERAGEAAALLREGKNIALLSEAGTPAVSDPGFRVVRAAIDAGARVIPVPGPSAVLAALVASGLPTDRFTFLGFPPRKSNARQALFRQLGALSASLVLYESPHRVAETLADLLAVLGPDRPACLARELTKTHEEIVRAPLGALAARYATDRPLGEITLVVAGAAENTDLETVDDPAVTARARRLLSAGYSSRDVADILAAETDRGRKETYALVLALQG